MRLDCAGCGRRHEGSYRGERCADCDGPLVVVVDLEPFARPGTIPREPDLPGLWRYLPLLPISHRSAIVSLGEGGTPRLDAPRLGRALGLERLCLKDESRNPTGSFKDRMLAVGIARARELGKTTVTVQSSGNVAAAASAYAARGGLRAEIFVPRTVPEEKLVQIQMYGARLHRIDESSPARVFELMEEAARELGWYVVSTTARYNPFTLEGAKTIAYELAEDSTLELPEWLVVPVGGGGNIGTLWKAFLELKDLGVVEQLPRLVGVQAEGCAPFVEAIRRDLSWQEAATKRWPEITTICGAIADDLVFDAHLALRAVRDSGGAAIAVSDDEILEAERLLAATEGIFVEPSSATSIAALPKLLEEGVLHRESSVCCLLTGAGLKDMSSARRLVHPVPLIPATTEAVLTHARRMS